MECIPSSQSEIVLAEQQASVRSNNNAESGSTYSFTDHHGSAEALEVYRLLKYSAAFSVPVFLVAVVFHRIPFFLHLFLTPCGPFRLGDWLKWTLVTPVQFLIGPRFYIAVYTALRNPAPTRRDVVVLWATAAAYTYAIVAVLYGALVGSWPRSYFETSTMLVTFVLFGKYLEVKAEDKSYDAIENLLELSPTTTLLVTLDAGGEPLSEREIDVKLIQEGDILKVQTGSRIPVDGVVVSGSSYVDESMLTGAPVEVPKARGDDVIGGTINVKDVINIRATRVGGDAALFRIASLVESVQIANDPVPKYADFVATIFVPIVVALSISTWVKW